MLYGNGTPLNYGIEEEAKLSVLSATVLGICKLVQI